LGPTRRARHARNDNANPLAGVEDLSARLLATRQERFGLAQIHDEVTRLGALHDAGDELTDLVAILAEDVIALGFANFLKDNLFGRLRGDAPKHVGRFVELYVTSELRRLDDTLRVFEGDLGLGRGDSFDDSLYEKDLDLTGLLVEASLIGLLRPIIFLRCREDGVLHRL